MCERSVAVREVRSWYDHADCDVQVAKMDYKAVLTFLIGASVLVLLAFLRPMEDDGQTQRTYYRQPAFKSSNAASGRVEDSQIRRQEEQPGQETEEQEEQKYHQQQHGLRQLDQMESLTSGQKNKDDPREDRDQPLSSSNAHITSVENDNGGDGNVAYDDGTADGRGEMGRRASGRYDQKQGLHVRDKEGEFDWRDTPAEVLEMAPEIFRRVPRQFDPRYKNPCWLTRASMESSSREILNCLPYFYIIGLPKCGTTELWDKITAHPDVLSTVPKEPHWWARRRLGWTETPIHRKQVLHIRAMTGDKDDSSFEWYLNLYKVYAASAIQSNTIDIDGGKEFHQMVFGDASVSTAWDRGFHTNEDKNLSTIDLIHAVQPAAKIIMIVRNPTDRDYSGFYYTGGKNPGKFSKKMEILINCFRKCLLNRTEKFCTYAQKKCGLVRSLYVVHAEEWMKAYGKLGVHVLRLEDWHANTMDEYKRLMKFLDLRTLDDKELDAIIHRRPKNVNAAKTRKEPMLESTRRALNEFYRPYNSRLAELLNDSRYEYEN